MTGLDEVLARYHPDCLVGQGDTTTVMAAERIVNLLVERLAKP